MSTLDLLMAYFRGLKQDVQRHVMLGNPSNMGHAMILADSAMWFSGSWQWSPHNVPARRQHHCENHGAQCGLNSGYAPMELGAAVAADGQGFRRKCYLCGKSGHMKCDCLKAKGKKPVQAKNA